MILRTGYSVVYFQRLDETNTLRNPGEFVDFNDAFCNAPGICTSLRSVDSDYSADTLAGFAAAESQLNEKWSLSLGIRIERREAKYADTWFDNGIFNTASGAPVSGNYRLDDDDNMLGGHFALWPMTGRMNSVFMAASRAVSRQVALIHL